MRTKEDGDTVGIEAEFENKGIGWEIKTVQLIGSPSIALEVPVHEKPFESHVLSVKFDNPVTFQVEVNAPPDKAHKVMEQLKDEIARLKLAIVLREAEFQKRIQHLNQTIRKHEQEIQHLRQFLDNPLCGFWEADAEGRFLYINRYLEKVSGYTLEEARQLNMTDVIAPEYQEWLMERMLRAKEREHEPDVVEAELVRKDGSRFWTLNAPAPRFDERENVIGFLGVLIDITERHQLELQLKQQAEALRSMNEALQQRQSDLRLFSSAMVHELRAPLRAILGYSRLIIERHQQELPSTVKSWIERIRRVGEKMDAVIDAVFGLMYLDRLIPQFEMIHLKRLLMEQIDDVRVLTGNEKIPCEIDVQDLTVYSDSRLLKLILENLLRNAFQYQKNAKNPWVGVSAGREPGGWFIKISDRGPGIPGDKHEQIFEPFVRLHADEEVMGWGLGLTIVRRCVEKLDGNLEIHSRTGEGTTFVIHFPVPELMPG